MNFVVTCLDQHQMAGDATSIGAIAQMGERLICIQEVGGSIPPGSTICGSAVAKQLFIQCSVFGSSEMRKAGAL